jgi:hypothetical protein
MQNKIRGGNVRIEYTRAKNAMIEKETLQGGDPEGWRPYDIRDPTRAETLIDGDPEGWRPKLPRWEVWRNGSPRPCRICFVCCNRFFVCC